MISRRSADDSEPLHLLSILERIGGRHTSPAMIVCPSYCNIIGRFVRALQIVVLVVLSGRLSI
jgi:hypothetical protein